MRVDRQLVTVPGEPPALAPVKTPSSVRTILLPQMVLDELASHVVQFEPGPDGLLFTSTHGKPIRRSDLNTLWRQAAMAAGVAGCTPHDLHHFAASVLIDQGASVKAVLRHLGHASAVTTLNVYAHLWRDAEDVTRRALEAGLAAFASQPRHDDAIADRS